LPFTISIPACFQSFFSLGKKHQPFQEARLLRHCSPSRASSAPENLMPLTFLSTASSSLASPPAFFTFSCSFFRALALSPVFFSWMLSTWKLTSPSAPVSAFATSRFESANLLTWPPDLL
jgi:hypothetical protein